MQTFVDMLSSDKIDISDLISHRFKLEEAKSAYDMILAHQEPTIGLVLEYDITSELKRSVKLKDVSLANSPLNISFIGAGNFAQNAILPRINGKCTLRGIVTNEGNMTRYIADKYGFSFCADDPAKIFEDEGTGTVFIVTRHNTHAMYATAALKAGKNVIVEKPMAMSMEELQQVKQAHEVAKGQLMLGFNRRFSPLTQTMLKLLPLGLPRAINIRINAGVVPADHWVHDPAVGGGRIIGEACHFIDLATHIASSKATTVQAIAMRQDPNLGDTVTINLSFDNGSIANISYFSNGNKNVPKERIEVFCGTSCYLIDDFTLLSVTSEKGEQKFKLKTQDKGHSKQFDLVLDALKNGKPFPITFDDVYHSSLLTLLALESMAVSRTITL